MTSQRSYEAQVRDALAQAGVTVSEIEERSFPDERWLVVFVAPEGLVVAQSLAGSIETSLNEASTTEDPAIVITFRPQKSEAPTGDTESSPRGRLAGQKVDQLIQLLEARSRTSDALPSLKYVEDPRASLSAVAASRHQFVYGRRGVGKTALLLEAKRQAERQGHLAVWINAHTFRKMEPADAFMVIAEAMVSTLITHGGTSTGSAFNRLSSLAAEIAEIRNRNAGSTRSADVLVSKLNSALRSILRSDLVRLYIFIDDFYLFPVELQPTALDYIAGALRDCDGWLKVASIERLTRPFEPSTRQGLEIPHDASVLDLDVTLEEPGAAQAFLEAVLSNYTSTVGIKRPSAIAKTQALGRLVLASGGVPRDYLNLFASSIVVARESRSDAREVGREDVAVAAGRSARSKKRDLEQDVRSDDAAQLLEALESISAEVKAQGYTYFRIDFTEKSDKGYERLGKLVDLRFAHLVQASLSDQSKSGVKYEAYMLDLSEFTDIRLQRGLNVLDLEDGKWTWRKTGQANSGRTLTRTQLRDTLRRAPLVVLQTLTAKLE